MNVSYLVRIYFLHIIVEILSSIRIASVEDFRVSQHCFRRNPFSKGNVKSYLPQDEESRSCMSADVRMNRVPGGPTGRSMEPRPICRCAPDLLPAYIPARYSRRIALAAGLTTSSVGFDLPTRGKARPGKAYSTVYARYDKYRNVVPEMGLAGTRFNFVPVTNLVKFWLRSNEDSG